MDLAQEEIAPWRKRSHRHHERHCRDWIEPEQQVPIEPGSRSNSDVVWVGIPIDQDQCRVRVALDLELLGIEQPILRGHDQRTRRP